MRARIRIVLPLVQVVIAAGLITSNYLGPNAIAYPGWIHPDRVLCDALNAPAALLRLCLFGLDSHLFPESWSHYFIFDTGVYLGLIWLVWYAVSIEIGGKGRSLLMPKTTWTRVGGDVAAVLLGLTVIVPLLQVGQHLRRDPFEILVVLLYLAWATAIVAFYGRDLWFTADKQAERRKEMR